MGKESRRNSYFFFALLFPFISLRFSSLFSLLVSSPPLPFPEFSRSRRKIGLFFARWSRIQPWIGDGSVIEDCHVPSIARFLACFFFCEISMERSIRKIISSFLGALFIGCLSIEIWILFPVLFDSPFFQGEKNCLCLKEMGGFVRSEWSLLYILSHWIMKIFVESVFQVFLIFIFERTILRNTKESHSCVIKEASNFLLAR